MNNILKLDAAISFFRSFYVMVQSLDICLPSSKYYTHSVMQSDLSKGKKYNTNGVKISPL